MPTDDCKFRFDELVEIVKGFHRGTQGYIRDVKYRWFRCPKYKIYDSKHDFMWITEDMLKSIDPKVAHESFNKKLEKIVK